MKIYSPGLVTVIIPCYNQAQYLPEALDSVIAQTYENWECIIVNDGATDNTEGVAQGYIVKDKRIKYIYQNNQGLSKARNSGFNLANGEYIQFLDCDDYLAPEKIFVQIEFFKSNNDYKVCYTGFYHYYQNKGIAKQDLNIDISDDPLYHILFAEDRKTGLTIHNALFHSTLWNDDEVPFTDNFKYWHEDWVFWIKTAMKTNKFKYISTPLVYYRIHDSGFTSSLENKLQNFTRAIFFIVEMIPTQYREDFISRNLKYAFEQYADYKLQKEVYQSFTWKMAKLIVKPILWIMPSQLKKQLKLKRN